MTMSTMKLTLRSVSLSHRPEARASDGKIGMNVRLVLAVAIVSLVAPAQLSADVIIDWNNVLLDTIRTNSIGPQPSTRIIASMNTAMYDAVNSIARTHQPYHANMTVVPGTSREAAAAQAAHRVLSGLVPASQAKYDTALASSLSGVPDGPGKSAGIALGNTVGAAILTPGKRWRECSGAIHSRIGPRRLAADSTSERPGVAPTVGHRDPVGHD
jgi:hypothetical protein